MSGIRRVRRRFVRFGRFSEGALAEFAEATNTSTRFLEAVVNRKIDPYIDFQIGKRSSKKLRSISAPLPELHHAQKVLLRKLDASWVHDNAHAYVPGRSVITCAQPHLGMRWGIKLDLQDFFTHVTAHHIESALFPQLDNNQAWLYSRLATRNPEAVRERLPRKYARRWQRKNAKYSLLWPLVRLASNEDDGWIYEGERLGKELNSATVQAIQRSKKTVGYLPQGAPTSGFMSNIAFKRIDRELTRIAESHGLTYTRYSDDMLFSSKLSDYSTQTCLELIEQVRICLANYAFTLNNAKTRILKPGGRMFFLGMLLDGQELRLTKERRDSLIGAFRDIAKFTLLNQDIRFSRGEHLRLGRHKDKKPYESDYFDVLSGYVRWARGVDTSLDTKLINQFVLDANALAQYSNPRDIIHVARLLDVELSEAISQLLPEPSESDWYRDENKLGPGGRSPEHLSERAQNLANRIGKARA